MNNSKFAIESVSLSQEEVRDRTPELREREGKILKIITAIREVSATKEWSTLKEEIFDELVNVLDMQIKTEAKKENPDTLKLNRLAGQIKWAEKYSDLQKLEDAFRVELTNVRKMLYGKTEENSG